MSTKELSLDKINKILEVKNEANRLIVLTRKKVEQVLPEGTLEYGYNIEPIRSLDVVEVDTNNRVIYVSVLLSKVGSVNCKIQRRERVVIPFEVYSNYSNKEFNITFFTLQEINDMEKAITDESIKLMKQIYALKNMKAELELMKERI